MLAQLEPIVRERAQAEAALDPSFAETRAIVVADVTTRWGRLFATNVLHDDLPSDAVASIGPLDLETLRDALSGDKRVLDTLSRAARPGLVLLVAVGEGSGGTIGVAASRLSLDTSAPVVLRVN